MDALTPAEWALVMGDRSDSGYRPGAAYIHGFNMGRLWADVRAGVPATSIHATEFDVRTLRSLADHFGYDVSQEPLEYLWWDVTLTKRDAGADS